jgi:replicative DNA helicase
MPEITSYRKDVQADFVKVPPHSIEAEQSVLGGLMIDPQAWDRIADRLQEKDFYRPDHRIIFQAIVELAERHSPIDVLTVAESLRAKHSLDKIGGDMMLFELAKNTPSAANITAYADIVHERSVLRQLLNVTYEIAEFTYRTEGRTSHEILDEAERKVFAISDRSSRNQGPMAIKTLLSKAVDRIDHLFHSNHSITGLSSGYSDLDEMTSGLQPSDLIIIAGRPSMGKTAFAMNIAEHAAIKGDKPVLVFSLEMPGDSLAMRMMSSLGRIDQHIVRTGKLKDEDWPRLSSAVSMLSEARLYIDDSPGLSPSELRARARRFTKEHGPLGLIVVDYLQLMQVPGYGENRTAEISEISRSLKLLAKELHVPLVALSQLNRSLEGRADKRPIMSDLRDSGSIEQDSDLILFIYRDEVYNENTPDKGIAEINIAKHRNGPIGKIRLTFLGKYTRFENFMPDQSFA